VAVQTQGQLTWLVPDHHGTGQLAINAVSLAVTRRYQLPFGAERGTAPTGWPGERGFVGGTTDVAVGLTHLGAREYDPGTGRFISVDPIIDYGDPQQMHGYAYGNNNPATYSDPDGLKPECGTGKACAKFNKTHVYNGKKFVKAPAKPRPRVKPKKVTCDPRHCALRENQPKKRGIVKSREKRAEEERKRAREIQAAQWKKKGAVLKDRWLKEQKEKIGKLSEYGDGAGSLGEVRDKIRDRRKNWPRSGNPAKKAAGIGKITAADHVLGAIKGAGTGADVVAKGMDFYSDVKGGMGTGQALAKLTGTVVAEVAGGAAGAIVGFGLCGPLCAVAGSVVGKMAGGMVAGWFYDEVT
jgi:RHS repeat-associated protein